MRKIILIALVLLLVVPSCELIMTPDCEKYNYAEITIRNVGDMDIYVDVTYKDMLKNDIQLLNPGASFKYRMTWGEVFCYASLTTTDTIIPYTENSNWVANRVYLPLCGEEKQEWTQNK